MSKSLSLFAPKTATERHALIRQPQQQRVLDALFAAYPDTISHAELCDRVGTNRVSHRIMELRLEGWQIDGLGSLPLDEDTQTQLYHLTSVERDVALDVLKELQGASMWQRLTWCAPALGMGEGAASADTPALPDVVEVD